MSHTLLVANRGEIACRVIRAAKKLSLRTVAVYSEADSELPHVALADEAVLIGPARAAESYLRPDILLAVARQTGAGLVHPGYGFLSENAGFALACEEAGLKFVGPSAKVIRLMGDKDQARQAAAKAGVPVLPGTGKLDPADEQAIVAAGAATGFPLLVKAAAGGGGIGMRTVRAPADLVAAVQATSGMAGKAFGDGSVYLERLVERARHVEIQIFGFGDGTAVHLFERDCSLQRRHQKVVEEARAPDIDGSVREKIAQAAVALACACNYAGAGTVEFLFDTMKQEFFFLEMNTRIQVEHPVTEMITGIDLVGAQLRLAMGDQLHAELAQDRIRANGHSVEVRVYAENPMKNFMPSPGPLTEFSVPESEGIRVETGYRAGNKVTPFYDPMIMKVIAHGESRLHAIERLQEALAGARITGIMHNVPYLRSILAHQGFRDAELHTGFLAQAHSEICA
ncbi:MAG: acetyl-CoA carboxylase biotin carboxylase subunit [Ramlibacter sp.]|jgi:3-methylcrotonyl-CoA carboxylase alpha subunit|nr:acetyl-CoA carboxylase biotin carboxylase subunit [Ramlibacter sp.]